ncbi:MAG: ribosome recycling factor [Bacteroidetes bacterium]|nr:ribosome recycling factor [Bacteroidota bacterium]MCH9028562.1 ribosome recycling factor [Bacteroidota bacterium]
MHTVIKDAKTRMDKSLEALRNDLAKIRSGKATTALLDGIKVESYGSLVPLKQVGNVSVLDSHTLSITPWEKPMTAVIEKAIMEANLGLNPVNDGTNLKIPVPAPTEERRRELVKLIKKYGEEIKIAVRNIRRDANDQLKKEEKEKKMSEDQLADAEDEVQKITNEHTKLIDEILKHKEEEIMRV